MRHIYMHIYIEAILFGDKRKKPLYITYVAYSLTFSHFLFCCYVFSFAFFIFSPLMPISFYFYSNYLEMKSEFGFENGKLYLDSRMENCISINRNIFYFIHRKRVIH